MLNTITLNNVLPRVFEGREAVSSSDIWSTTVEFSRPDRYLIVAESGTGKSSLCSFLYGNRNDYLGQILFDGTDIRGFGVDDWCRLRCDTLALLPQEMRVFPELTALENIMIKNRLTGFRSETDIRRMLDRLEIADKTDIPAGLMSIGQQQRVAIIRTVCQPFSFLIVDEPVSHLDERNNAEVAALLSEAADEQQAAIISTSVGNHLKLPVLTKSFSL